MEGWESGAGIGCVQLGRNGWGMLPWGTMPAPQGHQSRMDQERDTKMWGREQGNGKTGAGEGMMRLEEGRRWEETELAEGR